MIKRINSKTNSMIYLKINSKKSMFFQILMLVLFQILLFTALVMSSSKKQESVSVTSGSSSILELKRNIDYENTIDVTKLLSSSKILFDKIIKDVGSVRIVPGKLFEKSSLVSCEKFNSFPVVSDYCKIKKNDLSTYLKQYVSCSFLDINCNVEYYPDKNLIAFFGKTSDKEEILDNKNFKYQRSFYFDYPVEEIRNIDDANSIKEKIFLCQDKDCINKGLEDSNFIILQEDDNIIRKNFAKIISQLKKCQAKTYENCDCYIYDENLLQENQKVIFEKTGNGLVVSLIENDIVIIDDFIPNNNVVNYQGNVIDIEKIIIFKDGFYIDSEKLNGKNLFLNDFNQLVINSNKRFDCVEKINIIPKDKFSIKLLSELYWENPNSKGNAIYFDVKKGTEDEINIFYSNKDRFTNSFKKFLIDFKISSFNEDKRNELHLNDYSELTLIEIKLKNYDIISEEEKDILIKKISEVFFETSFISRYPDEKMILLRSTDENFDFAIELKDTIIPENPTELSIIQPLLFGEYALISFEESISEDILGYNIYNVNAPNNEDLYFSINPEDITYDHLPDVNKLFFYPDNSNNDLLLHSYFTKDISSDLKVNEFSENYNVLFLNEKNTFKFDNKIYSFIKLDKNTRYLSISAFDKSGNENVPVEFSEINFNIKYPLKSGTLVSKNIELSKPDSINILAPTTDIFDNDVYDLEKKVYYVCSNNKMDIFNFDSGETRSISGVPSKEEFESCISDSKKIFILIYYDYAENVMKDFYQQALNIYGSDLEENLNVFGFNIYEMALSVDSSGTITSYSLIE